MPNITPRKTLNHAFVVLTLAEHPEQVAVTIKGKTYRFTTCGNIACRREFWAARRLNKHHNYCSDGCAKTVEKGLKRERAIRYKAKRQQGPQRSEQQA